MEKTAGPAFAPAVFFLPELWDLVAPPKFNFVWGRGEPECHFNSSRKLRKHRNASFSGRQKPRPRCRFAYAGAPFRGNDGRPLIYWENTNRVYALRFSLL